MSVTVKRLWTQPYNFELKGALNWGQAHQLKALNHVLVYAELSDGAVGMAEAPPRPTIYGETPESIAAIVARECADLLVGQPLNSEDDIHSAYQRLSIIKNNNTAKGALDMALHMAFSRSGGKPLAALLEVDKTSVPVSFILGTGTLQEVMDEVQWVYEQGVRVLKVKVGKDFARETEQIRRIKQDYGSRIDVYVDANQCYTAENVMSHLKQLAELGVLWCEEPLPVTQMRNRETFHPLSPMPVIADDSVFSLADQRRENNFNTHDILNIKTARTGFSESGAMLRQAMLNAKGVMVGSQAGSLLGCLHALLFSAQEGINYPTEGTFYLKVKDHYEGMLTITEGAIYIKQVEETLNQIEADLMIHAA